MRIAGSSLVAIVLLAVTGAALADTAAVPPAASTEQFLGKALQASMMEVELGKLAQKNAQSTGVNALGVRMQRDHGRIVKVLSAVSRDKGMTIPTSLDSEQRGQIESLGTKSGADFDAAYVELMVSKHEEAMALYSAVAESSDPELSQVAKLALPTLREDQRLAGSYQKLSAGYDLQHVASR